LKAVQIKENVYWVGGIDWNLRNFHGYLTQKGSTYNAYLIIDDKITLIDTVKYYHYNEMIERISSVIDPKKIDYVISNHAEMDHSGSLPDLMDLIPGTEIIATANCERALKSYFKKDWKFRLVKAVILSIQGNTNSVSSLHQWFTGLITWLPILNRKIFFFPMMHLASTLPLQKGLMTGITWELFLKRLKSIMPI
jgi:flavorubredoxin